MAQQAEVAVHARQAAEVQHVGEEELSHGLVDIPSSNIYIYLIGGLEPFFLYMGNNHPN